MSTRTISNPQSAICNPTTVVQSLLNSRLFLFFASVLILYLNFLHNGYECFRSDHITQIPLIQLQADKSLFSRDWFLMNYGHFDVRFFHLFLIHIFAAPFGLSGGIFALYVVLIMATIWAWFEISRIVYGSRLPGMIAAIAGVFIYGIEIGTNHLFEKIMIPRTEAFAFAWWGLFFVLSGRPLLAGILMGLSAYCQAAEGAFFAVPMMLWILATGGSGTRRWKDFGLFLGGFVVMMLYPLIFKSKGFLNAQTVSDEEYIQLAAYIRHPHHMVPHLWGGMWPALLLLLTLTFNTWRKLKTQAPRAWSLGWMAVIIIGLLAVCTIFIEIHPVKNLIIAQPYRVAVLLYFLLLLIFSAHLLRLLEAPGYLPLARVLCLVISLQSWQMFILVAMVELVLMSLDDQQRRYPAWLGWVLLAAALGVDRIWTHDDASVLRTIAYAGLSLGVVKGFNLLRHSSRVTALAGVLTVAGAVLISSFFWLPYEKWINNPNYRHTRAAAIRCYDYQFKPLPIMALERLGVWAEKNTPKDSLFLIPPEREMYGFHLWAKRSVVFAFKFFPYNPRGLKDWKERYLALQGINDPNSIRSKQALREAMADIGGTLVDEAFFNLSAEQVLSVAERYGADYVITKTRYKNSRLQELASDYNHIKSATNGKVYRLYQIGKGPVAAKAKS